MSLTFSEAIEYVMHNKGKAFSFVPEVRLGKQIGGAIFVLMHNKEHDSDATEDPYHLYYFAARFRSSECEEDTYPPDDIPDEARKLSYHPTRADFSEFNGMETQIALKRLTDGIPRT